MLPILSLDDEQFSQISDQAKKLIAKYAPQWTDFNTHDPGITLLELFAWMKELQQYHLDQIGIDSRLKFLALLGERPREKKPAEVLVSIVTAEPKITIPRGTGFLAGDICFENSESSNFLARNLIDGFTKANNQITGFRNQISVDSGQINHFIFGKNPQGGEELYLCFDTPFVAKKLESMYIDIKDNYSICRNPIGEKFIPLATLQWEYLGEEGWFEIDNVIDETEAFIFDGKIILSINGEMKKATVENGNEGYWIRITLKKCHYDIDPVLHGLETNVLLLQQKRTKSMYEDFPWEITSEARIVPFTLDANLALKGDIELYLLIENHWRLTDKFQIKYDNHVGTATIVPSEELTKLGDIAQARVVCFDEDFTLDRNVEEGDGFPYQEYEISCEDVVGDGLRIMVEEEDGYLDWEKVYNFDNLGPEDRCYTYSEETRLIHFGDCEKGMAPEGRIKIIACHTSLGQSGNIKAESIEIIEDYPEFIKPINRRNAESGQDPETVDECFLRTRREMRKISRGVTYEDYEQLINETPGLMINRCKAIPSSKFTKSDGSIEENSVFLVVQPFTGNERKRLNRAYVENLHQHLEDKRLVGTRVNILSPEYAGIVIFAEIATKPYYRDAKERIEEAVKAYFEKEFKSFGHPVLYSSIYGIIDTLECVSGIKSLVIDAQGKNIKRSVGGDVILPPNGIGYLMEYDFIITAAE